MAFLSALVILIALTFFLANDIIDKSVRLWAFIIFFQHIPLIIFNRLGNEFLGIIYFVIVLVFFYVNSPKLILKYKRLLNPITLSLFTIFIALTIHYFLIGINPQNETGYELFYRVAIFNFPIYILLLFIIPMDDKAASDIVDGIVVYGFIFVLVVFFVTGIIQQDIGERSEFRDQFRISPIAAARTTGIIIIAALIKLFREGNFKTKQFSLVVMIASLALLFTTASRAALIFLVITIAIYLVFSSFKLYEKALIIASTVTITFILYSIIIQLQLPVVERLQDLQDYEQTLRYVRLEIAIQMVSNYEVGFFGLGPFGFGHETGLNHPHNYIAEMAVDYGFLGLLSFTILFLYGSVYSYQLMTKSNGEETVFALLFIYLFLNTLTSGDILVARHMHFSAILLAFVVLYVHRKKSL